MALQEDKTLAIKAAVWLGVKTGSPVGLTLLDTGVTMISYSLNGKEQPPIRVENGSIILPEGSDFNLVMSFLTARG